MSFAAATLHSRMAIEAPTPALPPDLLAQTAYWIREFALDLHRELPQKLHGYDHDGNGVVFHPEFIAYIDRPCRRESCHDLACSHNMRMIDPPQRQQATRAFRRLRKEAPREFDVLWMMCVHGVPIPDVATALTERAIRLEKPERYSESTILLLAISGVHKIQTWY